MIGLRDIKEEDEVEEGEEHLQEELLPCKEIKEEQSKEIKEEQSDSVIWMVCKNEEQGEEEDQYLHPYEQQHQGAQQQQQFFQKQKIKEGQQKQHQQIQIQELKKQQTHQQQHQQQVEQQQHWEQLLEQQQEEVWQQEQDPLEIEKPLGREEAHQMPSLHTLKPGMIFHGSGRMTTVEEEEGQDEDEDEDDEEINSFTPSREMKKQYRILLPIYESILWSDAFATAAARGSSAKPSVTLIGIRKEHFQLRWAVQKEWREQLVKKTQTTLTDLEQQLKPLQVLDRGEEEAGGGVSRKRKALEEKVNTAMAELIRIKATKLGKVSLPPRDTPLNWERISAQGFDGRRSAMECQLMWNHLLHPSINHKFFTKEEDLAVQQLMRCNGNNWDDIAKAMSTGRTGFLVMHHWMSSINPKVRPSKFSNEETKKLLDAVSLLRQGEHIPWSQVYQFLPQRTKAQIHRQWLLVNPDRSPKFTHEEKAVLVKASYVFGLDISNMAYFLISQTSTQVRKKFRQFILYPLLYKPWTRQEDNILLACGEPPRKSSARSNLHLPGRSPVQNKCRYFTLKLWQALQKENEEMPPPPLFPLANTTDPCKIENLRKLLTRDTLQDVTRLKEAVEDCRKDIQMQPFLEDLVAFRASQQLITSNSAKEGVNKPSFLRGSCHKSNKDAGTFSMFYNLMDRFLEPGRGWQPTSWNRSDNAIKSLKVLSELMLLQARSIEEEVETEEKATRKRRKANRSYKVFESRSSQKKNKACMSQDDSDLWNLLVEKWEEEEEEMLMRQDEGTAFTNSVGSDESGGGTSAASDAVCCVNGMPYIPPNTTTLGTWNSINIHLSALNEMAMGNFVFQKYLPDQLDNMTEAQLSTLLHESELMPFKARTCGWQGPKGRKKVLQSDICTPDFNTYSRLPRKRKVNPEETSSQQGSWTLPAVFCTPATLPQQDSAAAAATTMPSTSMDGSNKEESTHQVLTRDNADELLFHRMLSLFYWPVVMMPEQPTDEEVYEAERRVTSSIGSKQKKQEPKFKTLPRITKRRVKWSASYCGKEMGMEETMQRMEDLEKSMKGIQNRIQELKESNKRKRGMKRKRPEEPEPDTAQPQGPKQPEMQSAPVQDKEVVDEDPLSGIKRNTLNICRIKMKLKTLRKSLRMKELWEKRRQGLCAPRKKRGNSTKSKFLEHRPRETSTGRRKRAEKGTSKDC